MNFGHLTSHYLCSKEGALEVNREDINFITRIQNKITI